MLNLLLTRHRKLAEIPVYSFEKHSRLEQTTAIYSPHVLILEGIFALYDPRVLELMDMRVCLVLGSGEPLCSRVEVLIWNPV